jgi:peptide-methionine (S)-S-oxide reductase
MENNENNLDKATFAAGCFWGVEDAFRKLKGVTDAISGYSGGHTQNPTYEEVSTDKTGHAESVEVTYSPKEVTYNELLERFWKIHNPTTMNRQGPDVGSQYRSIIFYHTPEQKEAAEKSKKELDELGKYSDPVVTEIIPAQEFWKAEEYHQHYVEKHGGHGACPI